MFDKKTITILLLLISLTLIFTSIILADNNKEDEVLDTTIKMDEAMENHPLDITQVDKIINTGNGKTVIVDPLIVYCK